VIGIRRIASVLAGSKDRLALNDVRLKPSDCNILSTMHAVEALGREALTTITVPSRPAGHFFSSLPFIVLVL